MYQLALLASQQLTHIFHSVTLKQSQSAQDYSSMTFSTISM